MTATVARYSLQRLIPPTAEPISVAEAKQHLRIVNALEDTLIESYIAAAREYVETFCNRTLVKTTWKYQTEYFPSYSSESGPADFYDAGWRLPRAPLISVSSITYLDSAGVSQTLAATNYNVDYNTEPGLITLGYSQVWPTVYPQRNAITVTYLGGYGARTKTLLDLVSVLAGQTITINGLVFTAHATTTTIASREFSIAGNDAADATALVSVLSDPTYGVPNVAASNLSTSNAATNRVTLTPYAGTDITATPSAATITVSSSYEVTNGESVAAVPAVLKQAMKLLVNHWYENREPVGAGNLASIPLTVETLLWSERIMEFD